jgi:hypothetical protein
MNPSRRALLISGGAMALGPLAGCSGVVPDPLVPDLLRNRAYDTSVAAMGRQSRARNRPRDPYKSMLRPPPDSGQRPYPSDEAECFTLPDGWRRGRR